MNKRSELRKGARRIKVILLAVLLVSVGFVGFAQQNASTVIAQSVPDPEITLISPTSANLGDIITITVEGTNNGEDAKGANLHISFPEQDKVQLGKATSADILETLNSMVQIYHPGDTMGADYGSKTVEIDYPVATGIDYDNGWKNGETHTLSVDLLPRGTGSFKFEIKLTMEATDDSWYADPKKDGSESSVLDQQDEYVFERTITVNPPSTPFKVEFNDPDVSSGFHGERLVKVSSSIERDLPIEDDPLDDDYNNDGNTDHEFRHEYDKTLIGYSFDPTSNAWKTKFEIHFLSIAYSNMDVDGDGIGGIDYTDYASRIALLLLHYYWYGKEYLDYDPIRGNGPVPIWMNEWDTEFGYAYGEHNGHNLYLYDLDNNAMTYTITSWVQLLGHEYGHLVIPDIKGYETPEPNANGYLGQRLFPMWLTWNVDRYPGNSETNEWDSQGEVWDGSGSKYWDNFFDTPFSSFNEYDLITIFLNEGPTSNKIDDKNYAGMNYFTGLALYIVSSHGPIVLKFVLDLMKFTLSSSPQAFRNTYISVISTLPINLFKIEAEDFAPNLSTITHILLRDSDTYRKEIGLESGDKSTYWVYIKSGILSIVISAKAESPGETIDIEIDGNKKGALTIETDFYSLSMLNFISLASGWHKITLSYPSGSDRVTIDKFIVMEFNPLSPRFLWFGLASNAHLHLHDESGYHVGINYMTNYIDTEISYSDYYLIDEEQHIYIARANSDDYFITLTGTGTGPYELRIRSIVNGNVVVSEVITGSITPGDTQVYSIEVSPIGDLIISEAPPGLIIPSDLANADAGDDILTEEGKVVQFDGSQSQPGDGYDFQYEWTFDGITLTGVSPTFTFYDDYVVEITLTITYKIDIISIGEEGEVSITTETRTTSDTQTVTVLNLDPTTKVDRGYMEIDFTLRFAGEKWHNVYWDLYETDEAGENDNIGDGGTVGEGELIAHLESVRYPGDPDAQSDTAYDVYIDSEKIYYSITTYYPYEDDMPINGQPHGANPTWIDMTFEDGSTERIHHNFNEMQSIVRNSDHWVHKAPWALDFSPWLVTHTWTFEGSTTDQGTDDETFIWDWNDASPFDTAFYPFRRPNSATDPLPSPYDQGEGSYPVAVTDTQYHPYNWEDDFVFELTLEDDDFPADGEKENDGTSSDLFDIDAIHTREIILPDGTKLARR